MSSSQKKSETKGAISFKKKPVLNLNVHRNNNLMVVDFYDVNNTQTVNGYALESRIVVPVRLLIFKNFSHQYFLIPASTFINF